MTPAFAPGRLRVVHYIRGFARSSRSVSIDGSSTEFAGKVAVVTGAASFLGTAICSQLVAAGARVVLGDLDDAGLW